MQAYGDLLHLAGEGLKRIDTSDGWSGDAAEAFRKVFHGQPSKWLRAGDAFHQAARALDSYITTLIWAQGQAVDAINQWNSGKEQHEAAQHTLDSARGQLDSAGRTAAAEVGKARDLAPEKPGFWSSLGDDLGSFFSGAGHVAKEVGETVLTDLASVGNAMVQDPGSLLEVAGGLGLATLGVGGEVGGVALDATGIGALVGVPAAAVSATAIAGGLGMAGMGLSNIAQDAAGPDRVNMNSDGGGGGGGGDEPPNGPGHTLPERGPDPTAKAQGNPESIPKKADPETVRAITRQNEAADKLAQNGYDVEHAPDVPGSRNPDYRSPGLVRPPMCHRPLGQLPLQHAEQFVTEQRQRCRALGRQSSEPVLRPGPAPTLYRPDADPQVVSDDRGLVALPEPLGRLQPQLLPERPPFVGQSAPLRIPHATGVPQGSWTVSPTDTTL